MGMKREKEGENEEVAAHFKIMRWMDRLSGC